MIRILTIIVFALFIIVSAGVIVVTVKGATDETRVQQNIEDTKASTLLTGRFVEHIINERFGKLYGAAYSGTEEEVLKSIVEYTDFVANLYGHRGEFSIGYMDSGFTVINSINSGEQLCPQDAIVNEEIAERLVNEKPYVGPVSAKCAKAAENDRDYVIFAVPIIKDNIFKGAVYEISTLLDSINSYKLLNYFSEKVSARLIMDDLLRYKRGTEEYELLSMKNRTNPGEIIRKDDKLIGFYSFYVSDIKLCIVYIRDEPANSIGFDCCPVLMENKVVFYSIPFILLVLVVILEMIHVNKRLAREVSQRTQHLEEMQDRYQSLFETIPEYIVIYRKDGEIIECNSRFTSMLNGGNPIGANIFYMIREKERFRRMLSEVEESGVSTPAEFLLEGVRDLISVSIHSCKVELDDGKAFLSVMTDMSDYKRMQNTYYMAQKREVVGTIAAGMVHDFSNILQNISLQYSLLERSTEETREDYMKKIESVLSGANQYLASVLSYTKDKKNDPVVNKGSVYVKRALEMVERVLPADVRVEFHDNASGINISADQGRITQLLINLCQNASDAMDGKGVITVKVYVVEKPFGHFFCISVKDTGCGIPEDQKDKIYKPFYTTKKDKGTGLGLANVRQIVMEMGGMIDVESSPEGTEFTLMFSESK